MSVVLTFPSEARVQRIRTLRESLIDLEAVKTDIERQYGQVFADYREITLRLAEIVAEIDRLTGVAS